MIRATIIISLFKLLLVPSYRSTDFEVHRNWLAITHSLPLKEWYTNEASQWTLDYPPFFAWFEFFLAKFAVFFDASMLRVSNLNYDSQATVLFQCLSVIITDLVFAYSVRECVREVQKSVGKSSVDATTLFVIIFGNAGLFLVDHIHFQYNGFLFGILFLSIARMLQRREVEGAIWFAVLLNLKHIYLYMAPSFFIYLLRSYCLASSTDGKAKWRSFTLKRFLILGAVVLIVFSASMGPFVYLGQTKQVLSRLFPFKRGLSHAYWAPNFWALYNFLDKFLTTIGSRLDLIKEVSKAGMTGGLVQEFDHVILPSVHPAYTFILTFASMIPCLVKLWNHPHNPWQFVRTVTICGFCSFLFGWHVHEKAILLVILPLSLLCLMRREEAKLFLFLSIVGHFSLFPLIFTNLETPIKVCCWLLHGYVTSEFLRKFWKGSSHRLLSCVSCVPLMNIMESLYLFGLIPLFLYEQFIHKALGLDTRLPFLPLMLISVYCASGVLYVWGNLYKSLLQDSKRVRTKYS